MLLYRIFFAILINIALTTNLGLAQTPYDYVSTTVYINNDGRPPLVPLCGDGAINQTTEQCDDGNTNGGDGCSWNCQSEVPLAPVTSPSTVCGNSVKEDPPEECDQGASNGTPGCPCSSTCHNIETTDTSTSISP